MTLVAGTGARLSRRQWVLVVVYGLLVHLLSIAGRELTGRDEPRVAGIARAMAISGDFVVPRLNGTTFLEYPPAGYWLPALALKIAGGASELAAHLPGAFVAVATACLTAALGAGLATARVGTAAALVLETMVGFWGMHRSLLVDATLVFFVTLALAGFGLAWGGAPRARAWAACFWLGLAGGFLTKGLIGVGLPIAVAGAYAVLAWDRAGLRRIGLAWGWAVAAAPVALWLWRLERQGEGLAAIVVRQSVERFTSPTADHAAPWSFYFGPVLYQTAPLVLLAPWAAWLRLGPAKFRGAFSLGPAARLPLLWLGLTLVALSGASAKRNIYLAPIYPAAALVAALLWERARARVRRPEIWERTWLAGFAAFAVVVCCVSFLPEDRASTLRPAFERVARERGAKSVLLDRPSEALEGAAVFHLGETVPVVRSGEALASTLADGRPRIVVSETLRPEPESGAPRVLEEFRFGRSRILVGAAP